MCERNYPLLESARRTAKVDAVELSLSQPLDLAVRGGPVLVILILMSLFVVTVALVKLWQFRASEVGRSDFIPPALRALEEGTPADAHRILDSVRNPIARILETIADQKKNWAQDRLEEEIDRRARNELASLRRWLRTLELFSTIAPLLGLLGTVLGMIDAFGELQSASGRVEPGLLAGGIATALLTTAGGLVVAILASITLAWLEARIEALVITMEDTITRALHHHFELSLARRDHAATII